MSFSLRRQALNTVRIEATDFFFIGPQVVDRLNCGQFRKWRYCEVVNNGKWTFLKQVRHEGNALGLEGGLGPLAVPLPDSPVLQL